MALLSSKWLHHCMFSLAMSRWAFPLQILASICWYCEGFATVACVVFHCWNFRCSRYLCLGALKWHREHSILSSLLLCLLSLLFPSQSVIPGKKTPLQSYTIAPSCKVPALWGSLLPRCPLREKLPGCPWVKASSLLIPESHFTTKALCSSFTRPWCFPSVPEPSPWSNCPCCLSMKLTYSNPFLVPSTRLAHSR